MAIRNIELPFGLEATPGVSPDSLTLHMALILAELRKVFAKGREWRAGRITTVQLLEYMDNHDSGDCDCDECRTWRKG